MRKATLQVAFLLSYICIDNVITVEYAYSMNTTLQIRIDKKTKEAARKKFEAMGLDLSSGIKYLLTQAAKADNLSYICNFGYKHHYTPKMAKEYKKEVDWVLKHGKGYKNAKEMHAAIMRGE